MLEVALVTPVYSTSTVTCLCFLPLGSRRLTNIRERVCKVCRRCQTVMASFPSSLATGRFSFMVTLLDNKSGASVSPLRLLQPPPPVVHHAVILTPWSRVLLEKLTRPQSRNCPHFMEPAGSLPQSQQPATCPYPEPDRSSPCPHIPLPKDPS
jgi:hypothetical protein